MCKERSEQNFQNFESRGCGCIDMVKRRDFRECCDCNGCCGRFPAECRATFWPEFAHPTWLRCADLYSCIPVCPCESSSAQPSCD